MTTCLQALLRLRHNRPKAPCVHRHGTRRQPTQEPGVMKNLSHSIPRLRVSLKQFHQQVHALLGNIQCNQLGVTRLRTLRPGSKLSLELQRSHVMR